MGKGKDSGRAFKVTWAAVVFAVSAAGLLLAARGPWAQRSRSSPGQRDRIRWIVPAATGGGFDTLSRLIEPYYEDALGAYLRIDNIAGAGTIIGSEALKRAEPDGRTIGILNAPGLLVTGLAGQMRTPDLQESYSILGRLMGSQQVLLAGADSTVRNVDDLLAHAGQAPLVCGVTEIGASNFVSMVVAAHLLDIEVEFISGYSSSPQLVLAAVRGEVDLVCGTFASRLDAIEEGDLRPILQLTTERIASHPSLDGVPVLGGPEGLAARRAAELGRDVSAAVELAEALDQVFRVGRIVAAPKGLEAETYDRMEEGLHRAASHEEFRQSAARIRFPVEAVRGPEARKQLQDAVTGARRIAPLVSEAIEKARAP